MAATKKGSVSKGDIVYVDYDAYLADNDKMFDTTMAESAKTAGFFDEKFTYEPMPVLLGSGKLFEAFENAIENAEVGKETEVKIASADAAGARDPKLVETYQLKEFHKQDLNPYPGVEVQLGKRRGTVMYVGAGRVKVDFNNPLAGKDLIYKFTIREVVSDNIEKAKAVVKMTMGTSDGFEFTITDEKVTVTLPDLTTFDQTWPVARFSIVSDLRKVANVDTIEFVEVWALGEKKKTEGDEEKPAKKKPKAEAEPETDNEGPNEKDADDSEEKPVKKKPAATKESKAEEGAVKKDAKSASSTVKKETSKPKVDAAKDNKAIKTKNMGQKEK
jgi:FKBP-type peptidyl-prolyl cis-trans isomerase SlyD